MVGWSEVTLLFFYDLLFSLSLFYEIVLERGEGM